MKKYLVFIISFILLYAVFQLFSGFILTILNTPNFSTGASTQTVTFGETSKWSFLLMTIAASVAFFVSTKFQRG
ncbi:MAG: hypothetical protein C0P75_002635 [Bacilli bacterium]|jgi:hypothetical protein|uniref:Uncharacterized protein n=2 Tax=Ureibacillus TaxID=160795 RepID=A0ABW0RCY3_9BACL|nr:hypothetical protein [Bacilli bacterium]